MENIIKKNRPHISQSTVTSYIQKINNISKSIGENIQTSKDIIKYRDKIILYLNSISSNCARARSAAVLALLDSCYKSNSTIDTFEMFKNNINIYKQNQTKQINDAEYLNKKEGFVDWNYILDKYLNLRSEIGKIKLDDVSKDDFKKLQLFVILSCYILIPPRRSSDYLLFKIRNYDDNFNYMMNEKIDDKCKYYFVFNKYKTKNKYGQVKLEIPEDLSCIIRMWKLVNNRDYLILNKHGTKPISSSQLNNLLSDFLGERIGTNMLRHIYLCSNFTEEERDTYKKMKEISKMMSHSIEVQQTYYMK